MVIVAIVPALIVLLLLGLAGATLWRSLTLPKAAAHGAACGACGYPVENLTTFTCPECGKDLRAVGIQTPSSEARRRGSLTGALIAWTFLSMVLAYVGVQLVGATGAFTRVVPGAAASSSGIVLSPESRIFDRVTVASVPDPAAHADPLGVTIRLLDGRSRSIHIDADAMQVTAPGRAPVRWSPEALDDWFGELGLAMEDAAVAADAASLGAYLDTMLAVRGNPSSQPPPDRYAASHVWYGGAGAPMLQRNRVTMGAVYLAALLVYLLGVVWIVRRRKRILGRAEGA